MPSAGLLALLDDITSLLDDVATMTKLATKKTAGVIGDDLALNANQLTGACATRELPIIAAVAKGSLLNKAILIPSALLITALVPSLIKPLLMAGGAFLCFEGAEKITHKLKREKEIHPPPHQAPLDDSSERERIKGAVMTDFVLSAEILVIALGATAEATLLVQAVTLCAIGIGMTVLVYGSVALIVKADDFGLLLQGVSGSGLGSRCKRALGRGIIAAAPKLMKLLSFAGTAAMFLVGGEIIAHGIPWLEHALAPSVGVGTSSTLSWTTRWIAAAVHVGALLALGVGVGLLLLGVRGVAKKLKR